jgi:hypothetical protein
MPGEKVEPAAVAGLDWRWKLARAFKHAETFEDFSIAAICMQNVLRLTKHASIKGLSWKLESGGKESAAGKLKRTVTPIEQFIGSEGMDRDPIALMDRWTDLLVRQGKTE